MYHKRLHCESTETGRMAPADEKKERVIHTRISESLDEEIRERAMRLGVSVSNLVRNVLLNLFGLVEDIVAGTATLAKSAASEDKRAHPRRASAAADAKQRRPSGGGVLGWQEVILNIDAVCDGCDTILKK